MDNLITGFIAVAMFLAFIIGLAVSIKSIPFAIIVGFVSILIVVDYLQSLKEGLRVEKDRKTEHH